LTSKKLNGYLDHLRENLETLDEQIVNARKMSKKKGKDSNALQWAKVLRDLVELRGTTLANIKAHLLGRDETGATNEPHDIYAGNPQVEYERYFRSLLSPWTQQDLKLECKDCGVSSDQVRNRHFPSKYENYEEVRSAENINLCDKCYEKRIVKEEESDDSESGEPISNQEAMNLLPEGQEREDDVDLKEAVTDTIRNTIKAIALDDRSSAEKVKMLEEFKDHLVTTAYSSHASGDNIEPGVALLDKEIERLQKEAELGKGQDAAGKSAT
jgi:hypothetical protein